ncbi:MAG TPA: hypothetical protein VN823_24590 [Stellaceae bacterium]|nr:hypothetical protein [Stellaceae bacterium]
MSGDRSVDQRSSTALTLASGFVAAACIAAACLILARHPLAPIPLSSSIALYGLALWRWPALWLAVIPAILPTLDLTPWTGWMYVTESDVFVLTTLGVLLLRSPLSRADLTFGRGTGAIALALAAVGAIGTIRGLRLDLSPIGGSDNPYLRPDNALRLAKGLFSALALLPFLNRARRLHANSLVWFGVGMTVGLAIVAVAAIVERTLFVGLFDFNSDYRVVATFSSMHVGGGHIGAYIALALPFLAVCLLLRPRALFVTLMAAVGAAAVYSLIVTFARTAYVATFAAALVFCIGWATASVRGSRVGKLVIAVPVMVAMLIAAGVIVAAFQAEYMFQRIAELPEDARTRESNWSEGLALRDHDIMTSLFGMGLGTYPRALLARASGEIAATNFVARHDGERTYLSISADSPLYLDQKLLTLPEAPYTLSLEARSPDGKGAISALICEKLFLYSQNCQGNDLRLNAPGQWEPLAITIASDASQRRSPGIFHRPLDVSIFNAVRGTVIDVTSVHLRDRLGRELVDNGNFASGTQRWYFSDDQHSAWRILDQYLMTLFEEGALGVAVWLLLVGAALVNSWRGIRRGDRMGAMIAASLVAFLCSCVSDAVLEAPRLATVFYLIAFAGLTLIGANPRPGSD